MAIAVVPLLGTLDWILRSAADRPRRQFVLYGVLLIHWAAVHPGGRRLPARGLGSGATGYVGPEHPERWLPYPGRYALTLALLVLLFGLVPASRDPGQPETQAPAPSGRLKLLR